MFAFFESFARWRNIGQMGFQKPLQGCMNGGRWSGLWLIEENFEYKIDTKAQQTDFQEMP